MDALNPFTAYANLQEFMETGGWVLNWIMGATFIMWSIIIERYWYYWTAHGSVVRHAKRAWDDRSDHSSWFAHRIREALISEVRLSVNQSMIFLKAMVALLPMLGLLGTVTGMIQVFDVMAVAGSSNARAMAAGVKQATIPTMAGMVAALSGMFFVNSLEQRSRREVEAVADKLEIHHS
ncbi:MAG: MotA/TolQ/ExbB proton channel family protein [Alphaproteobacteria bacterium]|nr:MAG: MotA/TolQ/ExbB proton channel family protein [Alphaproteobacteria bacterium]